MQIESALQLTTNIADVPGVGPRRAAGFRKLGVRCVADLLVHLPARYEHELAEQTIADAGRTVGPEHNAEANLSIRGELAAVRAPLGRKQPFEATLHDGTGTVRLLWFNAPWMRGKLHPGATIIATGKIKRHGDYLQMANPRWQEANDSSAEPTRRERFVPVYPASESTPSAAIHQAIQLVLDQAIPQVEDHLPAAYRKRRELAALAEAYRMAHAPRSQAEIDEARRRLAFDDLLLLQLGVMMKRHHRREDHQAPALKHSRAINQHIRARIPFSLTDGQEAAVSELVADLTAPRPMNRLLQGDVGSGKTVVALFAMLMAVASGHQAALMAPTELLAEQHFESLGSMLADSRVRLELLTGSLRAAARRSLLKRLEAGEIDILVGTHALLTESVEFRSLAVAVIDEQHRFGVHQRAVLRTRRSDQLTVPHVLVMTATPIPRTLSLTVFGDLDISTIKGLPPGRKPIATRWVGQAKAHQVYDYVAEQISKGAQAYIVVPVIDESDSGLKDLASHLDWLSRGPLRDKRVEPMHGRLDRAQRDAVMSRFRVGDIDALVATTVIEVGVDVPNASIMVIEQADRFGLAQLHQLRGRVGRGQRRSVCVLIADPSTQDGKARLEAIVATTDGFAIAEKDFEIRGPGELFGSRQSGIAPFRAAELPRDLELLRMARRDAAEWIARNPALGGPHDALLRKRLLKAHGESLGLGDVA